MGKRLGQPSISQQMGLGGGYDNNGNNGNNSGYKHGYTHGHIHGHHMHGHTHTQQQYQYQQMAGNMDAVSVMTGDHDSFIGGGLDLDLDLDGGPSWVSDEGGQTYAGPPSVTGTLGPPGSINEFTSVSVSEGEGGDRDKDGVNNYTSPGYGYQNGGYQQNGGIQQAPSAQGGGGSPSPVGVGVQSNKDAASNVRFDVNVYAKTTSDRDNVILEGYASQQQQQADLLKDILVDDIGPASCNMQRTYGNSHSNSDDNGQPGGQRQQGKWDVDDGSVLTYGSQCGSVVSFQYRGESYESQSRVQVRTCIWAF